MVPSTRAACMGHSPRRARRRVRPSTATNSPVLRRPLRCHDSLPRLRSEPLLLEPRARAAGCFCLPELHASKALLGWLDCLFFHLTCRRGAGIALLISFPSALFKDRIYTSSGGLLVVQEREVSTCLQSLVKTSGNSSSRL